MITLTSKLRSLWLGLSLSLFLTVAVQASQTTWYVSPSGNDAWSGKLAEPNAAKTDGPKATLAAAVEASRTEAGKKRRIAIDKGEFFLDKTVELNSSDSKLSIQGAGRDETILYGGKLLPSKAFKAVTAEQASMIDPAARDKAKVLDLKTLGIEKVGTYQRRFTTPPAVPELFFNGKRLTVARWPNEGWATIEKIIDTGTQIRNNTPKDQRRPGTFQYGGDRPARWNVDRGVWLLGYWCYDWYSETIKVQSIDLEKRQITLATQAQYGVRKGNPSPRRYVALNLLKELDSPGEYYIDLEKGLLYLWPPSSISDSHITLSTLKTPVLKISNAKQVAISDLAVKSNLGNGVQILNGQFNRINSCKVCNVRSTGIHVSGGMMHQVQGCEVHDTGQSGIVLEGGDRKTLTAAHHEALDNHVYRFARLRRVYCPGISLRGVGNRAAHNYIHDTTHMAVGISGNDHVFELNKVQDVCNASDDAGALYKGRNPSCRNNMIRYNYWSDIGSKFGHGTAAVYFDDGDGGDVVYGNIFVRCGYPGKGSFGTIFSHGGHDNLAENNIFVDCERALGAAPWGDKRWKNYVDADLWQKRLLKEVDITKPPYTTQYPKLVGFMDPQPDQVRKNWAKNNVFVNCGEVIRAKRTNWDIDPATSFETKEDPGFVDAANNNYLLKPDSEVFKHLPNFKPIPFDCIGPRTSKQ